MRTGPHDGALRTARRCYDHLAGERGVALLDGMKRRGLLSGGDTPCLTGKGRAFFSGFEIDLPTIERARRPVCRACLDWSERRNHLGGGLGAAVLQTMMRRGWIVAGDGRVLLFSSAGHAAFQETFA